jgi:hypothetical protein
MIHPAKKPMKGGFSLEKFLPDLAPEDAEALGQMFDDMEAADDAASALDLLSRVRVDAGVGRTHAEPQEPKWRCTICGRDGTVGRCCGLETREPLNDAARAEWHIPNLHYDPDCGELFKEYHKPM